MTDASNASRTMLYDLDAGDWSDELCALLGVPRGAARRAPRRRAASSARSRRRRSSRSRRPRRGHPRRPAGGAVRPALPAQGDGEGDVRDRGVPARERRDATAARRRRPRHDGRVGPRRRSADGPSPSRAPRSWRAPRSSGSATSSASSRQRPRRAPRRVGRRRERRDLRPGARGLGSPWWDPDARGSLVGLSRGRHRARTSRARSSTRSATRAARCSTRCARRRRRSPSCASTAAPR